MALSNEKTIPRPLAECDAGLVGPPLRYTKHLIEFQILNLLGLRFFAVPSVIAGTFPANDAEMGFCLFELQA